MKTIFFILIGFVLLTGLALTGCNNNKENEVEDAVKKIQQADQDLKETQAEYEKEWQIFKTDAELKINAIKNKIEDYKAAMKTMDTVFKSKLENELLTLEQKNIGLQKKLNEYQYAGEDNWKEFKNGFNDGVDSLQYALKDIFDNID